MPTDKLSKTVDQVVSNARKDREQRDTGYRAKALKMYPWICGRCAREFSQQTLHELTVHHRDHDHDNNPEDGSNWELLCVYCHDNEHSRQLDHQYGSLTEDKTKEELGQHPFAGLADLLKK
ncbi:YajD family HNH nuclease [Cycloclasticus sp.]|uniref:YajD family HNH nuclease n=1 Tax=Cycloclasticus sp. TaxID=2024830 RepID=UPI000C0EF134|nr:YajD family HNH nuclease [Cycloclasticus sp.]PHR50734.1 MAG: HNH endonuclease [Cycloclasticus sp.]